jgi:hypothetical protein
MGRTLAPLVLVVPAVQLVLMLWVIWFRTGHVPWWDEWWMVPVLQHAQSGTLSFNDFWMLHFNSHRIVLPRLIQLILIPVTHWNRQAMMTFDLGVAIAAGWLIFASIQLTIKSPTALVALAVPLSLLYFSFSQYENWFGPWQLAFILTIFGVTCCLLGLHDEPGKLAGWRGFSLALIGAAVASLSVAGGLATWVVFFPSVARLRRQRPLRMGLWTASALAIIVPYMIGYPRAGGGLSLYHIAGFALIDLGAPIAYPSVGLARVVGLLGIALLGAVVYTYWRLHCSMDGILIWLCLALFALASALVTGVGRADLGTWTAILPRYQEFTCLFWVALLVIGARCVQGLVSAISARTPIRGLPDARALVGVAVLTVVLLSGFSVLANVAGFRVALPTQEGLLAQEQCVVASDPPPESCIAPFFLPNFVPISDQDLIAYIRREHLAIFADGGTAGHAGHVVTSRPFASIP